MRPSEIVSLRNSLEIMYELHIVSPSLANLYERLTSPRFRPLLTQENQDTIVAAAVRYCGQPAGLCLVEINEQGQVGIIRSLFVVPHLRTIGLGKELLLFTEQMLREKGCTKVTIRFVTEETSTLSIRNLLQRCGWEEPELYIEENKLDLSSFSKEKWIYRHHLPPSYKMMAWSQVRPAELEALKEQNWYPDYASPFMKHPNSIHLPTSFWLLRREEIVGWAITRENKTDTILYATLFVKKELQGTGCGILFLAKALQALFMTQIPFLNFILLHTSDSNSNLIRFSERRLKPFSLNTRKTWNAKKNII